MELRPRGPHGASDIGFGVHVLDEALHLVGGRHPSLPRTSWGASATHSEIAFNERFPARVAQTPSDTASQHTRWLGFYQHLAVLGVPGEPQSECFVELCSLFGVGVGEHGDHVAESFDEPAQLGDGGRVGGCCGAQRRAGAIVTAIEDLADGFIAERRVVEVGDVAGEPRWTTIELLLTENRVVERARAQRDAGAAIAQPDMVEAAIAARPSISDEQAAMVRHLTSSDAGIDVAVGAAGTGKTITFDAAREGWEASGYSVFGAALSARAAAELSTGSGIPAMTIIRLLNQLDDRRLILDAGCVVVIDESGMVGTRTLDAISRHTTEAGAKLVLCGDTAQLPEIDAGGSFRAMSLHAPSTTLVENRPQIHEWEIGALDDLRNGRVSEAVAAYGNNGRIIITADNADALRQKLVDDWFNAPGTDKVMIATRRADVADVADRARALLDAAGQFGNHELHTDRRIRVAGREFAVGHQVLATGRNHWDLDILNGDIGTVTRINERNKTVTFHCERVDAERTMPTERLEAGHLDHGYARTNYKTQGATADRIFTLGGDGDLDRQAAYTALSRGRIENRLYMCTPDDDVWDLLAPNPHRAQL